MFRTFTAILAALWVVFFISIARADTPPVFDLADTGKVTGRTPPTGNHRKNRSVKVGFKHRVSPVAWGDGVPLDLIAAARTHIGKGARELGLPHSLWCADFTNRLRREVGLPVVKSRTAIDQRRKGARLSKPVVGALAIFSRRGGGHVGVIADVKHGRVLLISGNDGRRVRERWRSMAGLIAVVNPWGA